MNKTELVDAVADASELSKADAGRAVDALVSVITGAMKKGDTVTLVGFGTFQVRARAARTGRNPKTGDSITISGLGTVLSGTGPSAVFATASARPEMTALAAASASTASVFPWRRRARLSGWLTSKTAMASACSMRERDAP